MESLLYTFSLISEATVQVRFLVIRIGFNLGVIVEEVGTLKININFISQINFSEAKGKLIPQK